MWNNFIFNLNRAYNQGSDAAQATIMVASIITALTILIAFGAVFVYLFGPVGIFGGFVLAAIARLIYAGVTGK